MNVNEHILGERFKRFSLLMQLLLKCRNIVYMFVEEKLCVTDEVNFLCVCVHGSRGE